MPERSDHGSPSAGSRSHSPSPRLDRLDRRRFLSLTGAAAAAAATAACAAETTGPQAKQTGGGPQVVFTPPQRKLSGSLSILMWSHFVPRHDTWFKGFVQDWGKRVGVDVRVDHINTTQVVPRIASEIQARKGHDLVQHIATLSQFEQSMLDMTDLVQEANRRWGKQLELCRKSSFNPNTNKFYAFAAGWSPDPSNYRKSLWSEVGLPDGPSSYDELLRGSSEIKKRKGVQLGLGLSQEIDSNMATRALMWSHGASIQDENEKVVINSDETVAAIEFMNRLFKESMTNEVFSWKPESNNQGIIAGKMSYILNSISAFRTASKANPKVSNDIFFVPALRGPTTALAAQHVMYNYAVPTHAANPDAAKEFLLHLTANFPAITYNSELYDLPGWTSLVPQLPGWLDDDPFGAAPKNKLSMLKDAVNWSTNIGYPGPANPAEGQIMSEFHVPNMFARAARGEVSPKQAAADAEKQINAIFDSWRKRGLVGG